MRYKAIVVAISLINIGLSRLAKLADIPIKLTTHVARHTFPRLADARIADKRKISSALRHTTLSMTETYLNDLRMSDLDEDMAVVYE